MREHQSGLFGDRNIKRCIHCGSAWAENMGISCVDRPGTSDVLAPEPARRVYASEAWDDIGARLVDLRKEREAIEAATAPAKIPAQASDECL